MYESIGLEVLILFKKLKKYNFFGCSPLPMKGRKHSSLCFANMVQQKCIYFSQNINPSQHWYVPCHCGPSEHLKILFIYVIEQDCTACLSFF
jgi:hypothetical protein